MRPIQAELLDGGALYREVVLGKLAHARESVWIATANVKAMYVERSGRFVPLLEVLDGLAARGVALRLLHAELPSRPFREEFDRRARLVKGGLELKVCPRVHFKTVLVDGAWAYLGSANLTGAGLGAKGEHARNFELGFVTEDFDVIDRVTAFYESVWSGASCRGCRLREVCPDPILPAGASRTVKGAPGGVQLGKARRLVRRGAKSSR
ncbi:phospholipase D Active site motif domain protein [Cystobacter fuscus DSM 2262]|uniref:Phospholipase D Active site motif domain protein n=1 Tax=Cystobacter fuscus (strain ATCC 25194 / DSM 2262 / NBRC 100088 / M29) TaxID=1242864 RepID=S9PCN1_CYSF2|nr:phospholipase D-like domain-containing protein [Cystobacter fuscus]EPX60047.1 phospholipase D Active site motif domain protein [Cystobacter fuscus DSM 2262]